MPRYADIISSDCAAAITSGAGTNYVIKTSGGVLYSVYVGNNNDDLFFKKSTDGGYSWTAPTLIYTGVVTQMAVWYDRWSDISAGLIHCVYSDSANDDTYYRTIDTESSDALSTQTGINTAWTTVVLTGSHLSIARARGGNVYVKAIVDNGAEGNFYRLPNANVPNGAWDAARAIDVDAANTQAGDMSILLPGFAADNQDMIEIFWDNSASEISRKLYDDSANSWSESSISTGMTLSAASVAFPNFAAAVDLTNSQIILIAWNGVDTANADLKCWTVTESAITAKTDVVTNGTDDQGLAAIGIATDTGYWHAFYVGASDGSETWNTAVNVYTKVSRDSGTSWDTETKISSEARRNTGAFCAPRFTGKPAVFSRIDDVQGPSMIRFNVQLPQPRAQHQMYGG
jgi:hypothetical protein